MTGGILQVTLLVNYLIAIASGNVMFEHEGSNAISCSKTPEQLTVENDFVTEKGPR